MQLGENLYALNDIIFTEEQLSGLGTDMEFTYAYIEPDVYKISNKRLLIVNFEKTMAEIAVKKDGLMHSLEVITNNSLIQKLISETESGNCHD